MSGLNCALGGACSLSCSILDAFPSSLTNSKNDVRVLQIDVPDLSMVCMLQQCANGGRISYTLCHSSALHLANLRRNVRNAENIHFAVFDPSTLVSAADVPYDIIIATPEVWSQFEAVLKRVLSHNGRVITWKAGRSSGDAAVIHVFVPFHEPSRDAPSTSSATSFPLTDIQHAYWIGRSSALNLGGVACHVYFEWEVDALDPVRLERAWNRLVARHGMLRAIMTPDGKQRILAEVPVYRVVVDDMRTAKPDDAETWRLNTRLRMSNQVLDAYTWPLFELRLTRMTEQTWCLHLDLDLLIVDVQSFHILLSELETLYYSPASALPEPGLTFRDYRLAVDAERTGEEYQRAREWWLSRLEDLPPPPMLPQNAAPETITAPSFRRLRRRLPMAQWQHLEAKARHHGITGSSLLLAAYSEVLTRWSSVPRFTLNLTQFDRRLEMAYTRGDEVELLALWDGKGAERPGGTAAFVTATKALGGRVTQIDIRTLKTV